MKEEILILWYCINTGHYEFFKVGVNPNEDSELKWIKVGAKK